MLAVDFQRRYELTTRLIKQALDAGRIGRPIFGDFRLKWYRADSYFAGGNPPGWRGTWKYDGRRLGGKPGHSRHRPDSLVHGAGAERACAHQYLQP